MEEELRAHRQRERRKTVLKKFRESLFNLFGPIGALEKVRWWESITPNPTVNVQSPSPNVDIGLSGVDDEMHISWIKVLKLAFIWFVFYVFFIYIEFGAVYFACSVLILISINTRTGPRKCGEVSAYSVFNSNCEAIDGTLKAEQFENEIRGRFL